VGTGGRFPGAKLAGVWGQILSFVQCWGWERIELCLSHSGNFTLGCHSYGIWRCVLGLSELDISIERSAFETSDPITPWHSVIPQKNGNLIYTAAKSSKLETSLYFYWLGSSFLRSKATGIWSRTHLRLVSRLGMCGAIPPLHTYLHVVHRNFRFFYYCLSQSVESRHVLLVAKMQPSSWTLMSVKVMCAYVLILRP